MYQQERKHHDLYLVLLGRSRAVLSIYSSTFKFGSVQQQQHVWISCLDFFYSTTAELPLTHICGLLSCLIIFIPKGVKIKKLKAHFVILCEIPSNIAQQQLQAPANEMPSHD